jgi:hypothetical protein
MLGTDSVPYCDNMATLTVTTYSRGENRQPDLPQPFDHSLPETQHVMPRDIYLPIPVEGSGSVDTYAPSVDAQKIHLLPTS